MFHIHTKNFQSSLTSPLPLFEGQSPSVVSLLGAAYGFYSLLGKAQTRNMQNWPSQTTAKSAMRSHLWGNSYLESWLSHVSISNNPLALHKIICSLTMVNIHPCSSLCQFPNQMTHELTLWNEGCQNDSVLTGSHRTQVALTCPG